MKKKTKSKLSFVSFGWSRFLRKACSETLGQGSQHNPTVFHMLRLLLSNAIYVRKMFEIHCKPQISAFALSLFQRNNDQFP